MGKTAILLIIATLILKCLGFLRDITLSFFYGTSTISDVYLISLTIPTVIFVFIGTALNTTFIPIYNTIIREKGTYEGNRFVNNVIHVLFLICTLLIILVLIFTGPIVEMFASGFDHKTVELSVSSIRISIFSVYFVILNYVFRGYLGIKKAFIVPIITGFSLNIVLILSIYFSKRFGQEYLSTGIVLAIASQAIMTIPSMLRKSFIYEFVLDFKDKYMRKMIIMCMPVVMGVSIGQINVLVDRSVASTMNVGGITALTYANNIGLLIQGLFIETFISMMYPTISQMQTENNIGGMKATLSSTIGTISLFVIPATIGMMLYAEPIVHLLYERGEFNNQAVSMTSGALFYYSIGTVGVGLREVLVRFYYATHNTRIPMINATLSMLINIGLILILSKYMGIRGLALATSLSSIVCAGLLFINLSKKIGTIVLTGTIISIVKMTLASLIMALSSKLVFDYVSTLLSENVTLLITILIGGCTYFALILVLKVPEIMRLLTQVRTKMELNKSLRRRASGVKQMDQPSTVYGKK